MNGKIDYYQLFQTMYRQYGPQHWWSSDSHWETMVGAVLVQNTNWQNVDRSLANLRSSTHFEPNNLLSLSDEALMLAIKPSGFNNAKSRTIKGLFRFLATVDFDLDTLNQMTTTTDLRRQLLAIKGIGPETADVILLYVFDRPVFIADLYARRLIVHLEHCSLKDLHYLKVQQVIEPQLLPQMTVKDCQEFLALIDDHGPAFLAAQK